MARALKTQNAPLVWAVLLADAIALGSFAHPTGPDVSSLFTGWFRSVVAAVAPVVVLLLTAVVPSEVKAGLVFWRVRDALPGHRAFSVHASRDARVDVSRLRSHVGTFPEAPREQNALWYRLYKKVENETAIALPHRQYLLFRDLAAVSLMLAILAPPILYALAAGSRSAVFAACLFAGQYLVTALAARNQAVRLVTSVLALHSAKRVVARGSR